MAAEAPTPQAVSYMAAQFALVAMRLANGDNLLALHHCVLLGHAAGETSEDPRVFREAAGILLDTFPPDLLKQVQETVTHYTGIKPQEDSP